MEKKKKITVLISCSIKCNVIQCFIEEPHALVHSIRIARQHEREQKKDRFTANAQAQFTPACECMKQHLNHLQMMMWLRMFSPIGNWHRMQSETHKRGTIMMKWETHRACYKIENMNRYRPKICIYRMSPILFTNIWFVIGYLVIAVSNSAHFFRLHFSFASLPHSHCKVSIAILTRNFSKLFANFRWDIRFGRFETTKSHLNRREIGNCDNILA